MLRIGLPEILDRHLPRHWLQQGLSWGWVTTIWLAHIVSQGDYRKLTVRDWVRQAHETLVKVTGHDIRDTDFTDDRLTLVLRELSRPEYWRLIERDLGQNTIRVYDLEQKTVRVDATTVSGYYTGGEDSLFQLGKSKDNPNLLQVKVMQGVLDPLGLPIATDVVSGEQADDGLYIPVIDRMLTILTQTGMLFVGDCKMAALATRAHVHDLGHHYLAPLALVGDTADMMRGWVQAALDGTQPLTPVLISTEDADADADPALASVQGYETCRPCTADVDGRVIEWIERVFVVYSESYAKAQARGLEHRLSTAATKLQALTPPRGRGTADRPQRTIERVRYQITSVVHHEADITALKDTFGWRAYATDAPAEHLPLEAAILTYRDEWLVERGFHRLKGVPLSLTPMFVKRDDQVEGLIHLLTIAVRLLTLIEFVVRRALKREQATLIGLHKENPKKPTATPTTERLLQAFSNINLSIVQLPGQQLSHVTPLSALQARILELLNLSPDIYRSLADNSA